MCKIQSHNKTVTGFTLIELLIVIAILAVLTAAVVIILNPAQILAESRDIQRLSDLQSVNSAIALYLATATGTVALGTQNRRTSATTADPCPFTVNSATSTYNATTSVDNTGWVGVKLTDTSGGSPLAALPLDPTNNANYYYIYGPDNDNKVYEIDARLESIKYRGKMTTDGGDDSDCPSSYIETTCYYETGNAPGLSL